MRKINIKKTANGCVVLLIGEQEMAFRDEQELLMYAAVVHSQFAERVTGTTHVNLEPNGTLLLEHPRHGFAIRFNNEKDGMAYADMIVDEIKNIRNAEKEQKKKHNGTNKITTRKNGRGNKVD